MGHARITGHVNAPINHVWDVNASCERLPEWNVNVIEVRDCPGGRVDRVGTKVTTVSRVMGRKIDGTAETIRADRPTAFAQRLTGAGGAQGTVQVTYQEAGGGTDVTVEFDYSLPGGMFAGIAEKLVGGSIERDLRHSMENFKELAEATVPAHA
jgi:uncharacterized membrane protein